MTGNEVGAAAGACLQEGGPRCPLCGGTEFGPMGRRPTAKCRSCGSLERTRLLYLYLQQLHLPDDARILHIAPERGLHDALRSRVPDGHYVPADVDPGRYAFAPDIVRLDLCDLDGQPSRRFDLIVHCHVLEHTPCNIAYTLWHLHRMLTPRGWHLCVIPFLKGTWDECFDEVGDEERSRRFGQFDHVRRFGNRDIPAHLGALLTLPESFDAAADLGEESLLQAHVPEGAWRGFTPNTVLRLRRDDMRLLRES